MTFVTSVDAAGAVWRYCHARGGEANRSTLAPGHFPLGTDAPLASLRHDGRYPGSVGFWLFGNFAEGGARSDDLRTSGCSH